MNNLKFSQQITIAASAERIFDYTQDYDRRLEWDTFLIEARLLDGATSAGRDVKAWCVAHNGQGMETTYVSYNRPKVAAIKMTRGPHLFKTFAASWNFREQAPAITEVVFLYSFSLRFPYIIVRPVIGFILQRNVRQRLRDLKKAMEAGNDTLPVGG